MVTTAEIQLDMIGLVVTDLARSLAFYRELGIDIPAEVDTQPHVDVTLANGMRLAWDTVETIHSFDPEWQPPSGGSHRIALAFRVDTPAGVDALYNKLIGLGYHGQLPPWDAFWGQRYASVHDPDGNGVDLFCPKD